MAAFLKPAAARSVG